MSTKTDDDLLPPREVVKQYIPVKVRTLDSWRCRKSYPLPFVRVGSRIFYKRGDVLKFIKSRREVPIKEAQPKRRRRAA
jgi:hypothetical protein